MNKHTFYSLIGRLVREIQNRIYLRRFELGISKTPLFDRQWYKAKYPDVGAAHIDPLLHYFQIGAAEGRDPNSLFSTKWYLERYPDVARTGENPLVHYLHAGAAEGRDPHPLFSTKWYRGRYPDVARSGENPLAHYLRIGAAEGRDPNPLFSTNWYVGRHPELTRSGENPLVHYLRNVRHWYLESHSNARGADTDPLDRFFQFGLLKQPTADPNGTVEGWPNAEKPLDRAQLPDLTQRNSRIEADWAFLSKVFARTPAGNAAHEFTKQAVTPELKERRLEVGVTSHSEGRAHSSGGYAAGRPMNIVIVSYGPYDNNSALHITGFANSLTASGHRVVVSAMGEPTLAGDFGVPRFRCITHRQLGDDPGILAEYFAKSGRNGPDLIHCWTPRSQVRSIAQPVIERHGCPYIVHFEDNEAAVAKALGSGDSLGHDSNETPQTVNSNGSMAQFIAGAAGATIIVDALKEILPEGLPFHLLEPGVNTSIFSPGLAPGERLRLCDALNVPSDARIAVYPGNVHPANADDMFSLYAAIQALNVLGRKVHLIRTGIDDLPVVDPVFATLSRQHVTSLGFVRREWLVEILKMADFFIQPGGPDDLNKYRLPSKIPEFMAMGRPVILPKTNIGLQLRHRDNALLMTRGDAAEITDCVKTLFDDPALADQIGRNGRSFAIEHFNWMRSTKQLESFYRQVLQCEEARIAR